MISNCIKHFCSQKKLVEERMIEEETARRVEEMVAKRVEEELEKRRGDIEKEVSHIVFINELLVVIGPIYLSYSVINRIAVVFL